VPSFQTPDALSGNIEDRRNEGWEHPSSLANYLKRHLDELADEFKFERIEDLKSAIIVRTTGSLNRISYARPSNVATGSLGQLQTSVTTFGERLDSERMAKYQEMIRHAPTRRHTRNIV
jgi:hypothetical protein